MSQVFCRWVPAVWPSARRNTELLRVLREVAPQWDDAAKDYFRVRKLSGGMTNTVVHCLLGKATDRKEILLRLYGHGTECLFDRQSELAALRQLGDHGLAPKVYAEFANGRVEEFLSATTLTPEAVRNAKYSRQIAASVAKVHANYKPEGGGSDLLLERLWAWYALALSDCGPRCRQTGVNVKALGPELVELEQRLEVGAESPFVAAHCDLQYGNIMSEPVGAQDPRLFLIDYEYSIPHCPRGFDLGNHFCEWGYDYRWEEGHIQDPDRFPTEDEKANFCEAYLIASDGREDWRPPADDVQSLVAEANTYIPVVNLHWGLWGLVQGVRHDNVDFDYSEYGAQRIRRFLEQVSE